MAAYLGAVSELDDAVGIFHAQGSHFLRREDFRTEALGLRDRATGEVPAAEARREAQVVFDARACARLAAGGFTLDHERAQSFGSTVYGGGKPRRAPAHDYDVVERESSMQLAANLFGDLLVGGLGKVGAVSEEHGWKLGCLQVERLNEALWTLSSVSRSDQW